MNNFNIYSRRTFLDRSFKTSLGIALATLTDIPFVMKRALAEGTIGLNGKKVLFIWLRFGNDGLNNIVPIEDSAYSTIRPTIGITKDPAAASDYYQQTGPCFDASLYADIGGTLRGSSDATFSYTRAIRTGNGFAALHPALKFLAPVYNAGDLALLHRVAYPKQSRSHFDSQNYWENGNPNNNLSKDGIFYRTIMESGLANTAPLTGVSVQSALPLILRGSRAAMTNLTSPTRYDLLGVPSPGGDNKAFSAIAGANYFPFTDKRNRELLDLQYQNMSNTLRIFSAIDFSDTGNVYRDDAVTDNDQVWFDGTGGTGSPANKGYYLFPTTNAKNGGYQRPSGGGTNTNKYVVPTSAYSFFTNLKAAAMILNKTDAIIAGTELGGFDTHQTQGGAAGSHANLLQSVGWAMYALRKYFMLYAEKTTWDNLVVVTLSEFGRTSVENSDKGTDHAEAGVMYVAGGGVKGYGQGNASGVFGCSPSDTLAWNPGPRTTSLASCGTMFSAGIPDDTGGTINPVTAGYLRRAIDYRSVLGEIIRKHLGATQNQLNRIITGYGVTNEYLLGGGKSGVDGIRIRGEVGLL
ncbi:MAG: DUF1501 domain-containing protein [Verrucomicrobia bacterium]|nr:MAG: DUF1501 domain-containing protein [Verrucomicrobiota bacterium]